VAGRSQWCTASSGCRHVNRQEILPPEIWSLPAPSCRAHAEELLDAALRETSVWLRLPFAPEAYRSTAGPTTVVALGPLTQLAAALQERPELAPAIERVVVAGDPADRDAWNLARDPAAVRAVRHARVRLQFVAARGRHCSEAWRFEPARRAQHSLADSVLDRCWSSRRRASTTSRLCQQSRRSSPAVPGRAALFAASRSGDVFMPREEVDVGGRLNEIMSRGRQLTQPVVLSDRSVPDVMLQEDVRARRDAIVAANGEDEWFAELLLNELHQHLGAYSILGVKMGLRAAELLNAPRHAMAVVSHAPATQPRAASTTACWPHRFDPGRGLFAASPGRRGPSARASPTTAAA
jgi:pyrimidine-specific ribonucleoside hydrolase